MDIFEDKKVSGMPFRSGEKPPLALFFVPMVHSTGAEKMVLKGLITGLVTMQISLSRSAREFTHGE
jgi:hypothetical protein